MLKVENNEWFEDITTYVVELLIKEDGKEEVLEANEKEMENLKLYETFQEVEDIGQEKIGSRWVITKKEKHDGQKSDYKARLVCRGFQEENKLLRKAQTSSP